MVAKKGPQAESKGAVRKGELLRIVNGWLEHGTFRREHKFGSVVAKKRARITDKVIRDPGMNCLSNWNGGSNN